MKRKPSRQPAPEGEAAGLQGRQANPVIMARDLDIGGLSDDAVRDFDRICLVRRPDLHDRPACWNKLQSRLETEPCGTRFRAQAGEKFGRAGVELFGLE